MSVELDVRNYLVSEGVSSTTATFIGPARKAGSNVPAEAVFVMAYGGPAPNGFQDGKGQTYRQNDVQIRIRGRINDYPRTVERAELVWQALNRTEAELTTPTVEYVRVEPLQSSYIYIGQNDEEQDECVVNVRLETLSYREALGLVYFGGSAVDIDSVGELALLTSTQANDFIDFTASAGVGEYLYYVAPTSFGVAEFEYSGFVGGFTQYATIGSLTVYRSNQPNLGLTSVGVRRAN